MGAKITLERAIYQGGRIVVANCVAPECWHSGEFRLIEMIDSFGAGTCLDDLEFRCTACGWRKTDVRARPFKHAGTGASGPLLESDGLPYGNQHMTWIER